MTKETYNLDANTFDITQPANFVEHPNRFMKRAANTSLELGRISMEFSRTYRTPRYETDTRESNVEHSFMTALDTTEYSVQYHPTYNHGLVTQFSIAHDLIELITGDVATFNISEEDLAAKDDEEHDALERLLQRVSPFWADIIVRYKHQEEPEARLVASKEKDNPYVVDLLGPGKMVMEDDYDVHTLEEFNECEANLQKRFRNRFPEPELELTHQIREYHGIQFSEVFEA
jgi:5'-deoxynucleotidase YfbR-like HD superfamily hydrolase